MIQKQAAAKDRKLPSAGSMIGAVIIASLISACAAKKSETEKTAEPAPPVAPTQTSNPQPAQADSTAGAPQAPAASVDGAANSSHGDVDVMAKASPTPAPKPPVASVAKPTVPPQPVAKPAASPTPKPVVSVPPKTPDAGQQKKPEPQTKPYLPAVYYKAAPWSQVSGSHVWTEAVIKVVRARIADFERARDKSEFCPGYADADSTAKEICWLRLVAGVSKFESSFNPKCSFQEPDGNYSVGLLALSPGECHQASTLELLKNPVHNLACGVNKMAGLIKESGFIDGPVSSRGAASYWSVLRVPYEADGYNLGKRNLITEITKRFVAFLDPSKVKPKPAAPAKPAPVTPVKPIVVTPAKPAPVAPAKPIIVAPAKPAPVAPAKPVIVAPAKPAPVIPAKPTQPSPDVKPAVKPKPKPKPKPRSDEDEDEE